jgi:hypothetical protein
MKIRQGGQLTQSDILIIRYMRSASCLPYPMELTTEQQPIGCIAKENLPDCLALAKFQLAKIR